MKLLQLFWSLNGSTNDYILFIVLIHNCMYFNVVFMTAITQKMISGPFNPTSTRQAPAGVKFTKSTIF